MKQPVARAIGIMSPPDGYTPEEKELERLISEASIETLYGRLPTSRMKAIVAMHYELGYGQELIAKVFAVSQEQIALDITNIKRVFLNKPYRPHKQASEITLPQLIEIILLLAKP